MKRHSGAAFCRRVNLVTGGFLVAVTLLVKCYASAETLAQTGILAPARVSDDRVVTAIRDAMLADDFSSAKASMAILSKQNPTSGQAEYWEGLLCLRTGKPEDAVRHLRASQKLADNGYTDEALALAYYFVKQFLLFKSLMTRASEELPGNFAPYYYLGRYYVSVDAENFEQAERLLSKALQYAPTNPQVLYYLGFSQESRRKLDPAKSSYKSALDASRNDVFYHGLAELGLARVSILTNQFADGLTHARSAEAALPNMSETHSVLAKLFTDKGDKQLAIDEWNAALLTDPANASAYYNLYRLYRQTGNSSLADRALVQYKSISKLYGTN